MRLSLFCGNPYSDLKEKLVKNPNIIAILVDDMGFSDIGCYGGEVETPNLDRLAARGIRFTDFYCTPRCCPSRASLLTGLTPHKAGVGWMNFDWHTYCDPAADGYVGTLNNSCVTIAEALQSAGYRSYLSGKWHLSARIADKSTWPIARGFDHSFSMISGGSSYFNPTELTLDDKFYRAPEKTYFTDLVGTYADRYIDEHHSHYPESPFFMYVAFTAPHFPLEAPEQAVAKYRETYAAGWDRLRFERYRRMIDMGIIKSEWELPLRPEHIPAWDSLPSDERERQSEMMATYAAMIEIMDANVGRIVERLERNDELENTLIMFLSDNGACAEGPVMGGESTYGECWAHLSNTPFRLYKHFTCQGGVQTPFIAHWPAGMDPENRGSFTDWTGSLYDIMPTCLEAAAAEYPSTYHGNSIHAPDGISFIGVLNGNIPQARPPIFIEHEGNQMLRSENYKIVRQHTDPYWELYDMVRDRSEMRDLSEEMPEKLTELAHRYFRWESEAHIVQWELAGRYMDRHGYGNHGRQVHREFEEAMEQTPTEEIVDGGAIGD